MIDQLLDLGTHKFGVCHLTCCNGCIWCWINWYKYIWSSICGIIAIKTTKEFIPPLKPLRLHHRLPFQSHLGCPSGPALFGPTARDQLVVNAIAHFLQLRYNWDDAPRRIGWPDGPKVAWNANHLLSTLGSLGCFFGGVIRQFLACSSTILEGWARAIQKIGQIEHHCWISTWPWMGKKGHCISLLHPCVYHHYPHEHSHFKGISVSPIFRQSHIHRRCQGLTVWWSTVLLIDHIDPPWWPLDRFKV